MPTTVHRVGAGVAVVLVAIAVVLAAQGSGGGDDPGAAPPAPPRLVDAGEVASFADSLGHEVYWAGERPPARLELSEEADGSAYLRYLPPRVEAGDPRAGFLTVGTYPVADAVGALRRTAASEGGTLQRGADGAAVLVNPTAAGSVYLAYPDSDLQIEVYDPGPGRALELIRSGAIGPVG